jgi:HlyD family secretion protein
MSRTTKIILILAGVVVLGIVLAAIFRKNGDRAEVEVEKPLIRRIVETVSASGKIQPEIEVKITAEVSGQIVELPVKEGDIVQQGDLLVRINPDIYNSALNRTDAALNTARSNLASSKARKAQAEAQFIAADQSFKRNKKLHEEGVISQAEFDQATSAFEIAKADVIAAEEGINSAEFAIRSAQASRNEAVDNLKRTTLIAPQSGTALTKEVGESVLGTSMMQGEEIMKVSDLRNMEVNVEVNESDIVRVALGDTAMIEVDAYREEIFKGVVTEISNTALNSLGGGMLSMNEVTNFSVKIRILRTSYEHLLKGKTENYTPFRPGMSATVDIRTEIEKSLSVPIRAVTTRKDTTSTKKRYTRNNDEEKEDIEEQDPFLCVFVIENGKAILKVVETGIQDSKYILIKNGISSDDQVITGPYDQVSRKLSNGAEVMIKEEKSKKNEE